MDMKVRTAVVAGCAGAGSVALIAGGWRCRMQTGICCLPAWRLGISRRLRQVVNWRPGGGLCFLLPGGREPRRLAVPGGGRRAGAGIFSNSTGCMPWWRGPGFLAGGGAFAWLSNWIWVIPFAMLAFFVPALPNRALRSPRWRPAAWFVGGAFALTTVGEVVSAGQFWSDPFNTLAQNPRVLAAMFVLVLVYAGGRRRCGRGAVRRSSGEERLQLKWFAAAALLVVATMIPTFVTNSVLVNVLNNWRFCACGWPIGVAVLKYRLYEDRHRDQQAVLYGSLACSSPPSTPAWSRAWGRWPVAGTARCLAALAAAVVAVAFQPGAPVGRGGWRTGSCTAGGPLRTRCCRNSPGASAALTRH